MSQQYLLTCSCGKQTPVTTAQAGRTLTCSCGEDLKVPTLGGLRQLAPAENDVSRDDAKPQAAWDGTRGSMFVVGVILTLIGLFVGGYGSFYRRMIDTTDHTKEWEQLDLADIDKLQPVESLHIFDRLKGMGLGDAGDAIFILARKEASFYTTVATIGFGIAAFGLVCGAASLIPNRK